MHHLGPSESRGGRRPLAPSQGIGSMMGLREEWRSEKVDFLVGFLEERFWGWTYSKVCMIQIAEEGGQAAGEDAAPGTAGSGLLLLLSSLRKLLPGLHQPTLLLLPAPPRHSPHLQPPETDNLCPTLAAVSKTVEQE